MAVSFEQMQERAKKIRPLRLLEGHDSQINSISFSPDGRLLASASDDNTIRLWDIDTGKQLRILEGHNDWIFTVCFSPAGNLLASGSFDQKVILWDFKTFNPLQILEGHKDHVWSVGFSPDGQMLASGGADNNVRLWDTRTGTPLRVLEGHNDCIYSTSFSPDGQLLASSSQDKTIRLWDVQIGRQIRVLQGHKGYIFTVVFSPNGQWLASCFGDKTLRLWEVSSGLQLWEDSYTNQVATAAWSTDSSLLISLSFAADDAIRFYHIESRDVFFKLPISFGPPIAGRPLAISPDGRLLVTYPPNSIKKLQVWDISALDVGPKRAEVKEKSPETKKFNPQVISSLQSHRQTLPLSHTIPPTPSRPGSWLRTTAITGVYPPLFLTQDLGSILSGPIDRLQIQKPSYLPYDLDTSAYLVFLKKLSSHHIVKNISTWDLSDSVIGIILSHLLKGVGFPVAYQFPQGTEALEFTKLLSAWFDRAQPARIWQNTEPAKRPHIDNIIPAGARAQIETNLHCLDIDELRFLHHYGPRFAGAPDSRELLDLFNLLNLPGPGKKALFSVLRLLPAISRTGTGKGTQTYAMGGYQGLSRKGNLDSIIPSELAYPEEMFFHRLLNHEALYYGREGLEEHRKELVYILTQSGLEMKGDPAVLASALTLALAQTMLNRGYEVHQSFIGGQWTNPAGLAKPSQVHRLLYYKEDGWLHPREMLIAVDSQLRQWGDRFQGKHVFWVVSEFFDADDWEEHEALYQSLKQQARLHAFFIRTGNITNPVNDKNLKKLSRQFHCCQVINTELMWEKDNIE